MGISKEDLDKFNASRESGKHEEFLRNELPCILNSRCRNLDENIVPKIIDNLSTENIDVSDVAWLKFHGASVKEIKDILLMNAKRISVLDKNFDDIVSTVTFRSGPIGGYKGGYNKPMGI